MTSAAETVPAHERGSLFGARMREAGWGYAFVLLPMAVFGLFFIYPLVYGIYISFFEWGILGKAPGATASTQNYHALYDDPVFHRALRNTFEYALLVVPLEMALGLLIALVINARIRGRAFFRSAFYFPSIASSAAITTIAIFILNPDGLLNRIIGGNQAWFGDSSTALYSVVGLNAWTTSGTVMLFYLAALQSIPTDVYEAAAVDGTAPMAHVLADHVPAPQAGALLRARRVRHRCAQGLRPVLHRLPGNRRPRVLDPERRLLHLPGGIQERELRGRRLGGRRALRRHLPAHADPARDGRTGGDRLMLQTSVAAAEPFVPPRAKSEVVRRIVLYVLLVAFALLFFTPFIWTISTSFKTLPDTAYFNFIPHPFTTEAWKSVWTDYDFKRYALNSLFLAVTVTLLNLFLASLGGYAFARLRFPGREVLFLIILGTLMIPDQLRLIPVFVMLTNWHLIGNFSGYILINLVTAVNLFFMRQYFLTIPRDFEEAAKLDGAGYFKTYWRIMLPLAGPAIAALAILQFQGTWNDFFWPLILFGQGSEHMYTMQLGLAQLTFTYQSLWPQLMAGSIMAIAPILVIFLVFQRFFVSGVTAAGIKG